VNVAHERAGQFARDPAAERRRQRQDVALYICRVRSSPARGGGALLVDGARQAYERVSLPAIAGQRRGFLFEGRLCEVRRDAQRATRGAFFDFHLVARAARRLGGQRVVLAIDPIREPRARAGIEAEQRVVPLTLQNALDRFIADAVHVHDRLRLVGERQRRRCVQRAFAGRGACGARPAA
jgi:hypothetical protein